jgi:hypothetical protein
LTRCPDVLPYTMKKSPIDRVEELTKRIKDLTAKRDALAREITTSPADRVKQDDRESYLRITYRGRKVSDAADLGMGYCGSCSFKCHVDQMNDSGSWVHSSAEHWFKLGLKSAS